MEGLSQCVKACNVVSHSVMGLKAELQSQQGLLQLLSLSQCNRGPSGTNEAYDVKSEPSLFWHKAM